MVKLSELRSEFMAKRAAGSTPRMRGDARKEPRARPAAAPTKQDQLLSSGEKTAAIHRPVQETTRDQHERTSGMLLANFGAVLRAARLKRGLKQSDVAAQTGLTQQYLSTIEAGQQNITLRTLVLLAEVVGEDVADMLRATTQRSTKK